MYIFFKYRFYVAENAKQFLDTNACLLWEVGSHLSDQNGPRNGFSHMRQNMCW